MSENGIGIRGLHFTFVPDKKTQSAGKLSTLSSKTRKYSTFSFFSGETQRLNMFQAINDGLKIAMEKDSSAGKTLIII